MNAYLSPKGSHRQFDPHTVLYLTGDANYSFIHLATGEVVLMSRTLKHYEHKWPWLIRIHKQTLINPEHAQQVIWAPRLIYPSYLVMANQVQLLIARRRLLGLIERLKSLDVRLIRVRPALARSQPAQSGGQVAIRTGLAT